MNLAETRKQEAENEKLHMVGKVFEKTAKYLKLALPIGDLAASVAVGSVNDRESCSLELTAFSRKPPYLGLS